MGVYETRSQCWQKILAVTGIPEEGSILDWWYWLRGISPHDPHEQLTYPPAPDRVARFRSSEGVTVLFKGDTTKWVCLPVALKP